MENDRVVIWGGNCLVSQPEDMQILLFLVISIRSSNFIMFSLLTSFACTLFRVVNINLLNPSHLVNFSLFSLLILIFNIYYLVQQPEIYDRLDQAVLLRQEQLLKAQPASLDSTSRYFYLMKYLMNNFQFPIEACA